MTFGLAYLNPILRAFLATSFTWLLTAIGAASVFLTNNVNQKVLDAMLGFLYKEKSTTPIYANFERKVGYEE